jgi:hypothetical protein
MVGQAIREDAARLSTADYVNRTCGRIRSTIIGFASQLEEEPTERVVPNHVPKRSECKER